MPQEVISKNTKNALAILKEAKLLKGFYLAGGTGLAFHLKHRLSLDLDFFSERNFNPKVLTQKIKKLGKFSVEKETENTLTGRLNNIWITFLKYDYPCLFPLKTFNGIEVADNKDIGCMKISAISSRGTKKDFIDLFFICQKIISLEKLLKLFKKKYRSIDYNMIHILKSLIYFEDAKEEPIPKMIIFISWKEIKKFFREEIKKVKENAL